MGIGRGRRLLQWDDAKMMQMNTQDLRPKDDEYFMALATVASMKATCYRRRVGCVLINSRKHVLSTGYNGSAAGTKHCFENPCPGANSPSGTSLDVCQALHAEQNALLQCSDVHDITTAYVTTAPCVTCTKLLMNTSCKIIVFWEDYPHSHKSKDLWEQGVGRMFINGSKQFDRSMLLKSLVDVRRGYINNMVDITWPV